MLFFFIVFNRIMLQSVNKTSFVSNISVYLLLLNNTFLYNKKKEHYLCIQLNCIRNTPRYKTNKQKLSEMLLISHHIIQTHLQRTSNAGYRSNQLNCKQYDCVFCFNGFFFCISNVLRVYESVYTLFFFVNFSCPFVWLNYGWKYAGWILSTWIPIVSR